MDARNFQELAKKSFEVQGFVHARAQNAVIPGTCACKGSKCRNSRDLCMQGLKMLCFPGKGQMLQFAVIVCMHGLNMP